MTDDWVSDLPEGVLWRTGLIDAVLGEGSGRSPVERAKIYGEVAVAAIMQLDSVAANNPGPLMGPAVQESLERIRSAHADVSVRRLR